MELIKKLTGKNPSEYELVAKNLVDNSDIELFKKLVNQDDFLFDFIKSNVAKRIMQACNKENYKNLLNFLKVYSPSYDTVIVEVLYLYSKNSLMKTFVELYFEGTDEEKAYAAKYFTFSYNELTEDVIEELRNNTKSDYEPLKINSIEVLSLLKDEISKNNAIENLDSSDEFAQYDSIKFLVNFKATDNVDKIIDVMKKSSLSENIAAEIPYLMSLEELIDKNIDEAMLVICNIINAIPEIISPNAICDFELESMLKKTLNRNLTSSTALMLQLAKDRFLELATNDEYLFDCDKTTKDTVQNIYKMLKSLNTGKLKSFYYEELFEESDFVLFASDYVNEIEELETLLESNNATLVIKVLSRLKSLNLLKNEHKVVAKKMVEDSTILSIIEAM